METWWEAFGDDLSLCEGAIDDAKCEKGVSATLR
jgi:hypothetical protein